jgi:hypothetical protein
MVLNFDVSVEMDADVSGGVERAQKARLEDAMDKGFAVSQEKVPVDRGTLKQSGYPPTWNGQTLEWGYAAAHALPMEEGTQPYYPPLQPLLEWSKRVSGGLGLGFYVARHKIPTEGIDSTPYAKPGAEAAKRYLKNNQLGKYLEREI